MPVITLAVNGALGKMGRRIVELAREDQSFEIATVLEAPGHPGLGKDWGAVVGAADLGVPVTPGLEKRVDVCIDFSTPVGTVRILDACLKVGSALVIGTTGLKPPENQRIAEAAKKIAVLQAPNMSVGINVLLKIAPQIALALGDSYDIEIAEIHHGLKVDAPSGTALRIGEVLAAELGRDLDEAAVHGRKGIARRQKGEIGFHAMRGGDVIGDHTVLFAGPGERIELTHRSHTRDTFAYGALRAARFLAGRPPGLYTIAEALGL